MNPDEVICFCQNVTSGMIKDAVDNGAATLEEVQKINRCRNRLRFVYRQSKTTCGTVCRGTRGKFLRKGIFADAFFGASFDKFIVTLCHLLYNYNTTPAI